MKRLTPSSLIAALALAFPAFQNQAQHGHLNSGAFDGDGDGGKDKLFFTNGDDFISGSGFVQTMDLATAGTFAGQYVATVPTFTAVAGTDRAWHSSGTYREADPAGALPGSFINLNLVSAEGPDGGLFRFYESGERLWAELDAADNFNFQGELNWPLTDANLIVGDGVTLDPTPTTTNQELGALEGTPGGVIDPYGHLHGRRMTATKPGTYKVGFRLSDASGQQADSDVFFLEYATNPEPPPRLTVLQGDSQLNLSWFGIDGRRYQLEESGDLNDWRSSGEPMPGDGERVEVEKPAGVTRQFYRLLETPGEE